MRAAVITDYDQPLRIQEVPVPEPHEGEVLVKIEASGLCSSASVAWGTWRSSTPVWPGRPWWRSTGRTAASH